VAGVRHHPGLASIVFIIELQLPSSRLEKRQRATRKRMSKRSEIIAFTKTQPFLCLVRGTRLGSSVVRDGLWLVLPAVKQLAI